MKKIKLLTALALASAAFAVSAQNIATVNGKPIPKSLQDEWVAQLVANGGKDTPEARRQITENLVANALVEQEAAKRKISDDPKVKFALDYAKFRILQEALLRDEMAKHRSAKKKSRLATKKKKQPLAIKNMKSATSWSKIRRPLRILKRNWLPAATSLLWPKNFLLTPAPKKTAET